MLWDHPPQVQVNWELAQGTQGGVSRAAATAVIPHLGGGVYVSPLLSFCCYPSCPSVPSPPGQVKDCPADKSCLNPFNSSSWLLGEPKSLSLPQGLDLV